MIFLRHINHIKSYIFLYENNKDNFYIKIIDIVETYNFLVLSFFSFTVIKILKKILIVYLELSVFSTFHIRGITLLLLNLTEVV